MLDITFLVLHTALVVFNLGGWIFERTRILHLCSLGITIGSWFVFAPWFGLGYCPCTDWHWDIKRAMGQTDLPNNYMTYLFDCWGITITDTMASEFAWKTTAVALAIAVGIQIYKKVKGLKCLKLA